MVIRGNKVSTKVVYYIQPLPQNIQISIFRVSVYF